MRDVIMQWRHDAERTNALTRMRVMNNNKTSLNEFWMRVVCAAEIVIEWCVIKPSMM